METKISEENLQNLERQDQKNLKSHLETKVLIGGLLFSSPTCMSSEVIERVMLVGWGGNNGSSLTGGVIANREGISWETKEKVQMVNYFGSLTQASSIMVGSFNSEEIYAPFKSLLPMVNLDDVVFGGWDISDMNLADAMTRAQVFDVDLQKQLRPYMESMVPLPGIFDPDFIAANQGARANNVIKGTKRQQMEQIIKHIRKRKSRGNHVPAPFSDTKTRSWVYTSFVAAALIFAAYYIGSASISNEYKERLSRWELIHKMPSTRNNLQGTKPSICQNRCRPVGSEALPEGVVSKTADLEMRPLWDTSLWKSSEANLVRQTDSKPLKSLLTMAVGIKQKNIVDEIVKKFISVDFAVMLFHYDGVENEWKDLAWNNRVLHVFAMNQTKWWFAKRFLHPDIVAEYEYIFLWDEDLGVEYFHPGRYLSIVKEEGLEISQPALDPVKSEVHHPITVRRKGSKFHRNYYKSKGGGRCDDNSTAPPCTGWVELMAPVFSRAAWRCSWYMIQSDLIHAWGLDYQLGYCAQGDRTRNVGVVDSEYIVHLALPTLGALPDNSTQSKSHKVDNRMEVRMQSSVEMRIFRTRWENASSEDICWTDPF